MIIICKSEIYKTSAEAKRIIEFCETYPGVKANIYMIEGKQRTLVEIHLLGNTMDVPIEPIENLPGVEKVFRVKEKYKSIGRHDEKVSSNSFEYNGITFSQKSFHVFAGLCAVDTSKNVESMFKVLKENNIQTTRAGAYKPRTSPYDFQGHGKKCLPFLFELAGKYDIKVISMEVTHESQIDEIDNALNESGKPTGVMLQIGTRNAQNFELLKNVGKQTKYPVLFKRGMGITLEESLNACEYVANSGNKNIIFCLRGMKTNYGDPHRNFVDFAHVPVVKRLTRLPVAIDPSHSVGKKVICPDGISEVYHATAQGVIVGANMILIDFHPDPKSALCDGPQAILTEDFPAFMEDVKIVRECYVRRIGNL